VPDRALLEPMGDPLADIFFGAAKTIVSRHAEVRLRLALLRLAVTVPSGELPADAGARFGLTDPQRLPVGAGFSALDPTRGERVTLTAPATARPSPVPADAADPGF
jgi:hypothetical protein